ncbi:MAG TPA: hypothetical protein VK152_01170, partial [Paludibacter sp.]|nr:hypothetical protein [Paludibacter sp.]
LQIWKDTFSNQSQFLGCECIIYTCPLHEIRSDEIKSEVERKRKENRIFIEKVQRELVEPLSLEFKIPITLRVKEDRSGIFHARFLVSEKVSLSVERGFDLYSPSGTLHRNFIRIDNGCHSHIHQCESLPEMT